MNSEKGEYCGWRKGYFESSATIIVYAFNC